MLIYKEPLAVSSIEFRQYKFGEGDVWIRLSDGSR